MIFIDILCALLLALVAGLLVLGISHLFKKNTGTKAELDAHTAKTKSWVNGSFVTIFLLCLVRVALNAFSSGVSAGAAGEGAADVIPPAA